MSSASKSKALALYRRLLRVARTWEGGMKEKQWIRQEARSQFEENLRVKDPQVINELIQKAHDQVDVALHYKIPYPRPHYVDPGTVGGDNDFHRLSSRSNTSNTRVRKSQMLRQFQQRGQIRRLGGL